MAHVGRSAVLEQAHLRKFGKLLQAHAERRQATHRKILATFDGQPPYTEEGLRNTPYVGTTSERAARAAGLKIPLATSLRS